MLSREHILTDLNSLYNLEMNSSWSIFYCYLKLCGFFVFVLFLIG